MASTPTKRPEVTAMDIQTQLHQLRAERALAVLEPVETVATRLADLDEEIEATRDAYVGAAITEIATLRGELFGRQVG